MIGEVRRFGRLGFGFITSKDGEDYFVHQGDIKMDGFRSLRVKDKVSFDVAINEENGKTKAINVKKIMEEK